MDNKNDCLQDENEQEYSSFILDSPCNDLEENKDDESKIFSAEKNELGDVTYYMKYYFKACMKMLHIMRSHHMLTDVVLEVGKELFYAHRVVLASASPYFKVKEII